MATHAMVTLRRTSAALVHLAGSAHAQLLIAGDDEKQRYVGWRATSS